MEEGFPPLVMNMFILYYLLCSNCITKVIQNLIRAAMKINKVAQQINNTEINKEINPQTEIICLF